MNIIKPLILLLASVTAFASPAWATADYIRNGNELVYVFYQGELLFCQSRTTGFEFCNGMNRSTDDGNKFIGPSVALPDDPSNRYNGSIIFSGDRAEFSVCISTSSCQSEQWVRDE